MGTLTDKDQRIIVGRVLKDTRFMNDREVRVFAQAAIVVLMKRIGPGETAEFLSTGAKGMARRVATEPAEGGKP